ncbi:MAG: protein kinase [Acidobacteriota bacterium]
MAKILFLRGPLARYEFVLKPEGFTMGRSPDNDLTLPDDSVSRRHARIYKDGDGWFVTDLGSLNGIRVNGEAAKQKPLLDRDVVVLGKSDIAFLERDDASYSMEDHTGELRRALQGRYVVERQLGSGAQADVYRARKPDGRIVAIKVLTKAAADVGTGDVRRFLREARALMSLRHPHIVEILEVDESEGFNFMVLEFLGGGSLEDRLDRQGRIPWRTGLSILADLARALVHAHARRIFHRDIKPPNVLFREDGSAVLSDFGIAQIMETTKLTRTGMVFGTPYFMSPGRLSGEPASAQSDLYALGSTIYLAITGQFPYPGSEVDDIIRAMKLGDCTPAHLLEPDVPRPLSELLTRCLTHDPAARLESAADLLKLIDALPVTMGDGPAEEDREGGVYRAQRFAYLTDVGLTFTVQEVPAGSMRSMKVLSPQLSTVPDHAKKLAELSGRTGARVIHRAGSTCLVADAPTGKTLGEIVTDSRCRTGLPQELALAIAGAIAHRLGASPLPHGDIDASMVALAPTGEVELLDAGYARLLDVAAYAASRRTSGKLSFAAPELLTGGGPSFPSDVYALGALLFWLLTGVPAIESGPQVERIDKVLSGRIREAALRRSGHEDATVDLVKRLMAVNPDKRPRAADIGKAIEELPLTRKSMSGDKLRDFVKTPRVFVESLAAR